MRAAVARRLVWLKEARRKQILPAGGWSTALALAGRGWGKTRWGAEDAWWYCATHPGHRYAVVAPTANDLRKVCIEGISGILASAPPEVFEGGNPDKAYNSSLAEIRFANGAVIQGFSAEMPGRLRGPQFHRAWCDELAVWARLAETWDMLQFGLRLGDAPQCLVSTTPKPVPLLYDLVKALDTILLRGSTYENKANLSPKFLAKMAQYEGTALGEQELHAQLIDLDERAIIKRSWWLPWREFGPDRQAVWPRDPILSFASIDPAYTEDDENDPSACTVWQVYRDRDGNERVVCRYAWEEWLGFPDLITKIQETCDHFRLRRVVVENKASGLSVIQELRRQSPDFLTHAWNPRGDKVARAHAVSPIIAGGLVSLGAALDDDDLPVLRPWADALVEHCAAFPYGPRKDLMDTVSQALLFIRSMGVALLPHEVPPPPPPSAGMRSGRRFY